MTAGPARFHQRLAMIMPTSLLVAFLLLPAPVAGQGLAQVMETLREGGSWVNIPIVDGHGRVESGTFPTIGLRLEGCARVWKGHSGTWRITARDSIADTTLEVSVEPDEPVRFQHETASRAKLTVDVLWSEARDTTLFLWVGLESPLREGDACTPPAD